jgi:hypothetical protein
MKFLLIVHRDDMALSGFLEAARKEGLGGFTLMPSSGIGRARKQENFEISLGNLTRLLTGSRLDNTTIFSIVADDKLARMLELMREHLTDLDRPGGGVYVVLPVESYGSLE